MSNARACSGCGKAGHYRPRCPNLAPAQPVPPPPKTPGERRAARTAARVHAERGLPVPAAASQSALPGVR